MRRAPRDARRDRLGARGRASTALACLEALRVCAAARCEEGRRRKKGPQHALASVVARASGGRCPPLSYAVDHIRPHREWLGSQDESLSAPRKRRRGLQQSRHRAARRLCSLGRRFGREFHSKQNGQHRNREHQRSSLGRLLDLLLVKKSAFAGREAQDDMEALRGV